MSSFAEGITSFVKSSIDTAAEAASSASDAALLAATGGASAVGVTAASKSDRRPSSLGRTLEVELQSNPMQEDDQSVENSSASSVEMQVKNPAVAPSSQKNYTKSKSHFGQRAHNDDDLDIVATEGKGFK